MLLVCTTRIVPYARMRRATRCVCCTRARVSPRVRTCACAAPCANARAHRPLVQVRTRACGAPTHQRDAPPLAADPHQEGTRPSLPPAPISHPRPRADPAHSLDVYRTVSILGYCLLPIVLLALVAVVVDLRGRTGACVWEGGWVGGCEVRGGVKRLRVRSARAQFMCAVRKHCAQCMCIVHVRCARALRACAVRVRSARAQCACAVRVRSAQA